MYKTYNKNEILEILGLLDGQLSKPDYIVLCGDCAIILQDLNFREADDIDFVFMPSTEIQEIIKNLIKNKSIEGHTFDYRSTGLFQTLEDFEDRLVDIKTDFNLLTVKVISLKDWVVSKLDNPKYRDIIDYDIVSLSLLKEIENEMDKYCGLSQERALVDLTFAKRDILDK